MLSQCASKVWIVGLVAMALLATVLSTAATAQVRQSRVIDSFDGDFGTPPSLTVGTDGIPRVAYYDPDIASLRVVSCANTTCSAISPDRPVIASIENGVAWPSMRLNPSGNPVIAYWDNFSIDLARCADPSCNSLASLRSVDSGPDVFGIPALALDESGFATVAFLDSDFVLNVVTCLTRTCSETSATWKPMPGEAVGSIPSIEIDDGLIIISYVINQPNGTRPMRVLTCENTSCASPEIFIRGGFFLDANVAADPDDPSYILVGGSILNLETGAARFSAEEFNQCDDTSFCQEFTAVGRPAFAEDARAGFEAEMAVDTFGRPVFAYIDLDLTGSLHVASAPPDGLGSRVVAPDPSIIGGYAPDIQIQDGRAAIAMVTANGLHLTVCDDDRCIPTCIDQLATVDIGVRGALGTPQQGDIVSGTQGNDVITGGHTVCARGGNDTISGVDRGGQVFAGQGNDVIDMSFRGFVSGGPGNDRITGSVGSDNIQGGPGTDVINGGSGNDRISGGSGNDTLYGENGDDELLGTLGRDLLDGGAGNDILRGGGWIDELDGGPGDDDRCSTIAGEVRVNCERGIVGI